MTDVATTEQHSITKKDLWRVFWNQMTIRTANNFERQQNAGFTQSMMPVIEKLYPDPEDRRDAYGRHMELFLSQDMVTAIPVGISVAMEEEYANKRDLPPDSINAVKTAMMGPLAGLGDSLINGTARPILAGLGASLVTSGLGWAGPIMFVAGMTAISVGVRWFGVFRGYSEGTKLVGQLQAGGLLGKISELAAIAAFVIVGGFIPLIVSITTPLAYSATSPGGEETVISIQETLDGLMPGLMGIAYTGLMLYLISKKKISAVVLMFVTMLVGIAGVFAGILG